MSRSSYWRRHGSFPWVFQDCSLDPGGAYVRMTDMFPPVPVVAQGEGCHCHGHGRRARPRGFCCSPAIVHGFSYPRAPRRTGRPGPARSLWTRFHIPGHAVCEWVCWEICTPHHRTSAIGEWYGIMLRMQLRGVTCRNPRRLAGPRSFTPAPLSVQSML